MAIDIKSLKKAKLEIRHASAKGELVITTVDIPVRLARQLFAGGAKRTLRKSEKGGAFDTFVVRVHTDAFVSRDGRYEANAAAHVNA